MAINHDDFLVCQQRVASPQPLIKTMNPDHSILIGMPVHTVAEIADCADSLRRVACCQPDGKVTGQLVRGEGRVVQGFDTSFNSEEMAVAHMDNLVTACLAWQESHGPSCLADAGFAC